MTETKTKGKPGRKPKTKLIIESKPAIEPTQPPIINVPAPEPPNPAIAALQEDIIQLVKQRSNARGQISDAMLALNQANARLTAAKDYLMGLEQEVSYRMGLIQQMKGETQPVNYLITSNFTSQPFEYVANAPAMDYPNGHGVSIPDGVSSIPAPRNIATMPSGPRIRSESAVAERNAETTARAVI